MTNKKSGKLISHKKNDRLTRYKKIKMLFITTMLMSIMLLLSACNKKEEIKYGEVENSGNGKVVLKEDMPVIKLDNILGELGADIDYITNVEIQNSDDYPDLQVWVDASKVNIFEAGVYDVVYTFTYDNKSFSKSVKVKMYDKEQSGTDSNNGESKVVNKDDDGIENSTLSSLEEETKIIVKNEVVTDSKGESKVIEVTQIVVVNRPNDNSNNNSNIKEDDTTKKVANNNNTATTKSTQTTTKNTQATTKATQTTKPPLVTSAGSQNTVVSKIGNAKIELLSGKTVSIPITNVKYIVSTRTDKSKVIKKNVEYEMLKLVITFSTGQEQVLETVERRIK